MLRIRSLESGYSGLRVLKNVSIHVNPGEIVGIIGANGVGKTTLLKTIAGIIRALEGDIEFSGKSISGMPAHHVAASGCVLVPEGRQLFAPMTVEENLYLGSFTRLRAGEGASVKMMLKQVYGMFPVLSQRKNQLSGTLSGGEQQMLAIGRALMAKPSLIMLDEPSMGLAPLVVKTIFSAIATLRNEGCTILIVEQNSRAVLRIANRGYVMETGTIVLEGEAKELLNNTEVRRAYLGKDYRTINE